MIVDEMKDHYKTLQVARFAHQDVVEAAYKALLKQFHPDKGLSVSGERAREINEAYEELTKRRSEYDRNLKSEKPKTIGNYKILSPLAEGGFGRTYKAEHIINRELVCIKDCFNISKEENEFLIEESRTVWNLRHYALPAMRDLIQMEDGRVVLVMSYIEGPTLEQLVKKVGAIDFEHVCWITERIINAMNYMHRSGVVHGDIKPQNIIVQEDKHMAVLVDFGLSSVKPTSTSDAKGYTPFFAAPEQIAGKPLLPETDYYSLGMTMLFALGGGSDFVERKLVPNDVPDELCRFIKKLIARDIASRPQYGKDDLGDMIVQVREKVFGRRRSNLKPICGK
jgi:serine/threonine protein kinase